jgi:hypothetical protein
MLEQQHDLGDHQRAEQRDREAAELDVVLVEDQLLDEH